MLSHHWHASRSELKKEGEGGHIPVDFHFLWPYRSRCQCFRQCRARIYPTIPTLQASETPGEKETQSNRSNRIIRPHSRNQVITPHSRNQVSSNVESNERALNVETARQELRKLSFWAPGIFQWDDNSTRLQTRNSLPDKEVKNVMSMKSLKSRRNTYLSKHTSVRSIHRHKELFLPG